MSSDSTFSRLCVLIDESLRPYTETEVVYLTKGQEKDLLIALSQVLREIQIWIHKLDCDSDTECYAESELHREDCNCLTKILADLVKVPLLMVESQYVQHLVGNILVLMSEFAALSGTEWDSFIQSLCICLELVITNVLSYSLPPSTNGAEDSNCGPSSFAVLKRKLKNANWSTAAGIIRVLRHSLKYLKQEHDNQLLEIYLGFVGSLLSSVCWDSIDEINFGQRSDTRESNSKNCQITDDLFFRNVGEKETKVMFLGNFIQFLCSLVVQSSAVEAKVDLQDRHPTLSIIIPLVPKLLHWYLGKQANCVKMPIYWYFRHKLLMLMLRLSYQTQLGSSTLVSWLQLLHNHFEELLQKPITELKSGEDECLEGSPFLLSLCEGEVHGMHSLHLQRQTVLLFLRCCFSLINLTGETTQQCVCTTLNSCSTFDAVTDLDCCNRKKGFLELYKWLQGHLPADMILDHETYLEKCIGFASSFLQLCIHEDDILFKVLLQLHGVPSCSEKQLHGGKWTLQDVKEDDLLHVSTVFNPVFLFHLFLAELHYDHQVLLDYLISKDTGISCAEYLLRCLRMISNSWDLFVKFSVDGKAINQSSCKKRKTSLDCSDYQAQPSSMPVKSIPPLLEEESKRGSEYGLKHYRINRQPFKEAKACLLSLKDSVENLHQKNLFPYNPEVLLKRLTKFAQLCFNHNNDDLS